MGFFPGKGDQPSESEIVETPEMESAVLEECDPESLIRQLAEKEKENEELKEKNNQLLRHVADVENFKKRLEKERNDLREFANESLIKDLLPVVDNLELAVSHAREQENTTALLEGVENVLKGFLQVITKYGVTAIESQGAAFDPAFHNAVMQQEDDSVEDQTVIQELQKGYLLKNRLLRPSMVMVARNPKSV